MDSHRQHKTNFALNHHRLNRPEPWQQAETRKEQYRDEEKGWTGA